MGDNVPRFTFVRNPLSSNLTVPAKSFEMIKSSNSLHFVRISVKTGSIFVLS